MPRVDVTVPAHLMKIWAKFMSYSLDTSTHAAKGTMGSNE